MTKVWFITGSSRGLGRSITEAVLVNGDKVAATARKPEQLQTLPEQYGNNVLLLLLDVTNKIQIRHAVEQTMQQFGRIDVLVNNAGFGIIGAAEASTDEQGKAPSDVYLDVGFEDISHFSFAFKKLYGIAPSRV